MGREFDRSVLVGIFLLALLVAANTAVSLRNTWRVRDNADRVAHTHEVMAAAAAVRTDLWEMEAAQRTFLLTGAEPAYESFRRSGQVARDGLARLKDLTDDNPDQQGRLAVGDSLERTVRQLEASVRVRRREEAEAAARVVVGGASRNLLDETNRLMVEVDAVERTLLADRAHVNDRAYSNAMLFGAAAVFGLVAVVLFAWLLRRSARGRAAETAAVHREREWLRTTLASIGDAVIATDAAGNVTFLNPVAEALTGWPQAEASDQPLTKVFHIVNESTRAPVENPALRALRHGEVVGLANHTVLIAKDGSERPIDDSAAPIRDGSAVGGAVLVFWDIGERKKAEEAQARLAAIVESSGDAILGKTLDGVIRYWNTGAVRVFGYSAGEAVGRHITMLIPPERLDEEQSIIERLKRGGRVDHFETVRVAKGGRRVDISLTVSPIRDAHGHVIGASKVARDVTGRKLAEAERERLAEALRLALDAADLGTWDWDPATDQIALSDRGAAIYGLAPGRTYAREWIRGLLHPEYRDRARERAVRAAAERTDYDLEYRLDRPTDGPAWVAARGRGVYGPGGELVRMLGVVQDVAARKRDEAALRAGAERNRFLLDLEAATRPLTDPAAVMAAANRVLGERLRANRVLYFEIAGPDFLVEQDYADGVAPLTGRYPVASFGAALAEAFMACRTVVEADATTLPGRSEDERAAFAAIRVRGHVDVPLVKAGVFVAGLTVHSGTPREWTADEVALIETTAERTWAAVERARAERTLRASEERFRTLFEAMDEGYCVVEPVFDAAGRPADYRYVLANPALEHLTGLRDVVGKTAREVMPGHESHWVEAYARVAATGGAVRRTERAVDLKRWFEVSAFPVGDGLVGVLFSDVTARTEAEAGLRASEQRLADVFQRAPSFMCVLRGPDHVFERANDRYFELLGRSDIIGKPVREALPEVEGQGFFEILDGVYRTGAPFVGTSMRVALLRGGRMEERVLEFVYLPVRNAGGAVSGVLAHGVDLTDRVRAEEEVRDADRKKDDFIALLAHELRNPLAPIRNGLQVLRLSPDRDARDRSQAMMDRQLTHMVRLIDDLLDVSRLGRHKMELRRGRGTLADVVASALETARPAVEEAGHELTVSLPPQTVPLDADLTRLSQVLSNLLTNSAKYTERGGRIWLSAVAGDGSVALTVRDTGIGIPAHALPTIFDMFSQVDRTLERSTGGLGIGLALVKGLVEMHGGTVTARSDGQGRGSEFTVTLPALRDEAEALPATPPNDGRLGSPPKRRVLVVDDNKDGAESLAEMLSLLGNEVETAHDGLEAVDAAERFRPEAILMDVGMPRLNRLDATRRIRGHAWGAGITIIALTGWGQDGDRAQSKEAGCDGHLVKPVSLADLQHVLEETRRDLA